MVDRVEVRRGSYYDSVTLMRASQRLASLPGVKTALVAMGTPVNIDLLTGLGFERPDAKATDLCIAVRAAGAQQTEHALSAVDEVLAHQPAAKETGPAPAVIPTLAAAAAGADIALISVPGDHAFVEAMDALEHGLSVMVFSDNVGVEEEILLKEEAARRGLLALGPDAGTTILSGVGLGFTNAVSPGNVGLVAASGTGAQQLVCLLDAAGVGVSHVLGVGGRDLSDRVGARSTLRCLKLLDSDPATDMIVMVSKPPGPETARRVRAAAGDLSKPVAFALLDESTEDLSATAAKLLSQLGVAAPAWREILPAEPQAATGGRLAGLFAGGTLCKEAMIVVSAGSTPVRSNVPLRAEWRLPVPSRWLDTPLADGCHVMVDYGDDEFTAGRLHPMVDNSLRVQHLLAAANDPHIGVIMLDVVLGFGAHPDPAGELAPAIRRARATAARGGRSLPVVVSLCGTEGDPQGWTRQAEEFAAAGASVHLSNAAAARRALSLAGTGA